MVHQNSLPFEASAVRGYRLEKVELFNWGTFDGQIYRATPSGNSALLIGQNGSGKSTLVDALLTLLVRPGVRNFNVAAGAKKRERDERSYLLGAFDRSSDEDHQNIRVKYLRPKGDSYSVILASFRNEDISKIFTIAQVLYLASDHSVEKIYCFSDDERSIQTDFGQLQTSESILKILKQRGLRATRTFQEYEGWFTKATRVKNKAMEVFNQTVAVKDIQKLNDFIRNHMLEAHDWGDKVDRLLGHFTQLSEAHDSLVRVRQQRDLLEPVATAGEEYREFECSLKEAEALLNASPVYFSQRTVDLFVPAIEEREQEIASIGKSRERLEAEIVTLRENCRTIQNQIDKVGGDRLKLIPGLIDVARTKSSHKRSVYSEFQIALSSLSLKRKVESISAFESMQSKLPSLQAELQSQLIDTTEHQNNTLLQRGDVRKQLAEFRDELAGLELRKENIPEWCVRLRKHLCDELGVAIRDLPFAAELMQVRDDENIWESSIENVLRGLALSLLVPDRFYGLVSTHVERTRLAVDGRGQRLVYLRVAEQSTNHSARPLDEQSLIRKLNLREGHSLLPWLTAELRDRFDYRCCDTIEEFQSCRGLALTLHRHVKSGRQRHEKDDRDQAIDPRNFVLGWDNREKKRRLSEEVSRLAVIETQLSNQIELLSDQLSVLRQSLSAIVDAQKVKSFDDIDFTRHEEEIKKLERERVAIESQSDELMTFKRRLIESQDSLKKIEESRDRLIGDERELETHNSQARQILSNARKHLEQFHDVDALERLNPIFADLDSHFANSPLTSETIFDNKQRWQDLQNHTISQLRDDIEPKRNRLTDAMAKFLRSCPEESNDLRTSTDYLDAFLELRQHILDEDLPRHEQRFKERLNQKVIEEIGLFRNALEQERRG